MIHTAPAEQEGFLEDLLNCIAGKKKWTCVGPGFHTYPGRDTNNIALHEGCLELEKRGLVRRRQLSADHWVWSKKE